MRYLVIFRARFCCLIARLRELPCHPYSPHYARWETVLYMRMELVREQAAQQQRVRELGLRQQHGRWVVPAPTQR